MDIVQLSQELMRKQTVKNECPAWALTEIAVNKGKELAKIYNVDASLVVVSLYLAHTVFSPVWKGEVQKNHPALSAKFVKKYLDKWQVDTREQEIILNAIEAHHDQVSTTSKVGEVVKNAECFKFVTVEGSLIFLHDLGLRGYSFDDAVKMVLEKMEQKRALLTLDACIKEANVNCKKISTLFKLFIYNGAHN